MISRKKDLFQKSSANLEFFGYSFPFGITVVLLFGLALRFLLFFIFRPWELDFETYELFQYDPQEYHILAKSLLNGSFDNNTLRTPGFPAFIALIYSIFGIKPWIVFLVQIPMSVISVYLVYKISNIHFSDKVSLTAAFLLAIDPLQIISPFNLFSEVIFIPFLLSSIYFFLLSYEKQNLKNLILSAIALGLTIYIRPIAIYLPIVLSVIILFTKREKWRVLLKQSVLYILTVFLVLSPWFTRNLILFDKFEFSIAGGYNMLYVYAAAIIYDRDNGSIDDAILEVARRVDERAGGPVENPFELEKLQAEIAAEIIKENPGVFLLNHLTGSINLYYSFSTFRIATMLGADDHLMNAKFYGTNNLTQLRAFVEGKSFLSLFVTFFSAILFTFEYMFAAIGALYLLKKRHLLILSVLIGTIIYQTALVGVLGNNARFKLPIEPFYLILTAYGIQQIYTIWVNRKNLKGGIKIPKK